MSKIIFEDEYVIVVPTFAETTSHKHDFYHIFFLGNKECCDEIYVTGSGMKHTMPSLDECVLFLMIDPTSDLADFLRDEILVDGKPVRFNIKAKLNLTGVDYVNDLYESEEKSIYTLRYVIKRCLCENGFYKPRNLSSGMMDENQLEVDKDSYDYRVIKLIKEIKEYKHVDKKINEIALEYNLSESRLSHMFKENVGISLKGYLTIARLKYAYELVIQGKSKTFASMEAGFATPAHQAYVCKKQMGISITDVLKDS